MSTTGAPEHDDRPRPSRARRLVRTVVLVVLLGLCGLLVLLHLPPVKTLVGASLARLLSRAAAAEVSFERLDYRLWFGVASVEGLSVRRPGLDVTGERATIRLRPSGMHVQIADSRVIVTEDADTSRPLAPSRPWAIIGRFAGVMVERLSIELRDRDGAAWLHASGIEARFERYDDRSRGTARVARADINWPGSGPRLVGARAEAVIEIDLASEALHLIEGRLAIGGSSLQAAGRLDQIGPVIGTAKVDGRIDAPLVTGFTPAIDAEGMLDVRLSATHDGHDTNGTIEVDAPRLMFAGAGPLSGGLRGRFDGQRLLVDSIDLRGSGGQVSANGVVFLGEGESLLNVRARGIDVANLGSAFTGTRPPLASNADMDLRLEIENWNADTLTGSGHVSFNPGPGAGLPVSGRLDITLNRSGVNFVARELRVHEARLAVDGSLTFPADLAVEYSLQLPNLAEAPALLADADIRLPPLALEGSAEVAGRLTGQLPDWRLDARLATQGLAVEEVEIDLDTTLLITPAGARISSLVAQGAEGHIEATGFVPLDDESEWAVDAEVAGVQLIDALSRRGIPIQATIDGRVQVDGPATQPRARFTVEAQAALDDARARDGAIGAPARLHAAGSVSHRNLILEQATAEVAGGRVDASGSWTWSDSSVEGRLTADGIAIERLPWLSTVAYEVTSTLSADLSVSGTAGAPVGRASVTLTGNVHRERALSDVTLEATSDGALASLNGRIGTRPFLTGTLAFRDEWPLHLDLDLAELPITELLPAVPALSETDATVSLSGRLSMDLPALSPRDVRYQARVTHLDARLRRTWQADAFTMTGDLQAFEIQGLTLETGSLRLYVEGRAALDESVTDAVLTIRGEVPLSDLAAVIPDAEFDGKADLDVRVTGSVFDPALDGTLQLVAGPGRLQRLRWKDAQLRGRLADETFTVEDGRATLIRGEVSMTGSVQLGLGTTARGFDLRVTATDVDLAPFFATADARALESTSAVLVDFSAQLAAPALTLAALDGQGQLTRLELAAGEQAMHLDAPVTWRVRDGTLDHSPLRLRGPSGAALDVAAQLQAGQLAVRVNGQADLAVAQPFLGDTARLSGPVVLDLALATSPDGVALTGEARVDQARILLREPRLAIVGLTGTLRATGARVELVDLTARVGDGQLTAAGYLTIPTAATSTVAASTADRGFDLRVTATGVDLAPFVALRDGRSIESTSTVLVDFSAQLAAPALTLAALDGQGQLTRLELAAGELAMRLDAPVTWHIRDGTLDHSPLRLRGPSGAALDVAAQLQAGQLAVRVNGQADLAVAQPFLGDTARLSGPVVLDLALATGPDGVTLTGEATVDNARILLREPRLAIDGLTGTLRASGARVELVDVTAHVGDGQLTAAGYVTMPAATSTIPASETSPITPSPADRGFDLRVTATGVDLAPLLATAEGRSGEATSTVLVDFSAQLAAPALTLAALDGQGQLTRLELAAGEQAMHLDAPVTWRVRAGTLDHSPLRLRGPSGAALDVAAQLQAGQLAVRVNGQADLAVAQPFLADTARLSGPVVVDLALATGPDGVTLTGEATVDNARILLREPRLAIDGLTGTLRATGARVELVDLTARVGDGQLTAAGHVTLPVSETSPITPNPAERGFDLRVTATGVDLAPFFATADARALESTSAVLVDFSAQLAAPALTLAALDGQGQLTRLELAAGEQAMHLDAPVTWRVRDGTLDHSPLRLRGASGAALDVAAQLQAGQLAVRVNGQADLAVAQPFLGDTARLSGPVVLDLALATGPDGVTLSGEARVDQARILLREPRLAIDGLTGTLRATGARVELVDLTARVGDGQLTAAGHVTLPSTDSLGVDVNLKFDRVPLNHPEGLRSRASGTLRMVGGAGRYRLEGDVALHRAVYDRKLDRTTQSLDRVGLELAALDAGASPLQRAELDIRMRLEDGLRIENDEARLVVDGAVRIGGDLLTPDLRGTLSLRDGGTVEVSRATLRISQGRIELDGFPAQAPELNIQGSTQVTGVLIDATISGPVDNFNLSLSSRNRSDLTQGDLASLILTGRTASDAMSDSGAIVAERFAASLGRALDAKTGSAVFIDVSRDEDLIVQDTNPSQRLNIGVPVGRNIFVIYSNALDRNAPRWTVELRPRGELRVRLISDSEDGNAIQVAHRFSFNVWSRRGIERPATTRSLRIARILLEGVNPEEEVSLRQSLSLEPGGAFDFFRADESARAIRAELRHQGYAAATVEFADRDVGSGRVDVIFDVQRGPRFDIEWRGDDPGGRARRRVEEGWDSFFPVEDTAARLADDLRWTLRADRYFNVSVSADATVTDEMADVIFDVRRGSRGRRVDLVFEGNDAITPQVLRAALPPTNDAAFFRMLDAEGRTQLTSALRLVYAREGFLEALAGTPLEKFDAASGVLSVTIPVDEGPLARVVELTLPEYVRSSGAPPPDLQLAVGQPFRIDAYVEDRGRLVSWYREQGFTTARVTSVLEPVDDGLVVRFGVDPGPRARVGDIRLAREGHTRPSVVNNAMTLAPGDLIQPSELQQSRRYLSDTGVFRSVDIRSESTAPGKQDLVVDLLPRDDLTVEYNVRYTTDGNGGVGDSPTSEPSDPIQFGAAIEASNPFGFAHRYRLYGLVGGERALLGASFDAATFFGFRWRTQVFLFDDQDRVAEIPRLLGHIRGGTFQQTKRWQDGRAGSQWRDSLRMIWGYTYKRVHYSDSTTGQALSGDRAGLIHSLIGDTRDDLTDPHRGVFWSVGTELALQTLGSDVDYAKLYGQLYYYLPLGARVVWAQGYRVGVTPGDDPLLLLEGRFHAGGASSVRGFEENTLGPQTGDGESLGGQAVAIFNQELRFPIVKRLWGGIFYDAGNAFALTSDLALGSLRHSAGGGLRLMLPFGPVRLEHAWVLDPKGGENRSRWVFSLGHAF